MSDADMNPPTGSSATPAPRGWTLHDPRTVPAARGIDWVREGFGHFRSAPGAWIAILLVGFLISVGLSLLPLVNIVAQLLSYVWVGGLMLGCKAQDDGEPLTLSYLFAGFKTRFGALLSLGVLYVLAYVGAFALIFIALGPSFVSDFLAGNGDPAEILAFAPVFLLVILIVLLAAIPLVMCVWFAPSLIVFDGVGVFNAIAMSFMGCLRNMLPFLLYGIALLVLFLIGMAPLMLAVYFQYQGNSFSFVPLIVGALVLLLFLLAAVPTTLGSVYRSYRDIYID